MRHFILVDREPIQTDLLTWARWYEDAMTKNRGETIVAYMMIAPEVEVSTVFLPLEPIYSGIQNLNPPILFETKIFGGVDDDYCKRYCSWETARLGHREIVEKLLSGERLTERTEV